MLCYFSDLRYREVIDIHTGLRLGYVCDLEFDDSDGRIISLVTPGRAKMLGLLAGKTTMCCPGAASSA